MVRILKKILERLIPSFIFSRMIVAYHFLLSLFSALIAGFPSRKLFVIGITGTKGKSSVSEMMNAILEEAGYRTALANTIRFKIDKDSRRNLFKMTMPGRGFLQHFLKEAKKKDCTHVVFEITSEGARQFRNAFIDLNALIFTNIAPEHIESHGSYDAYKKAKVSIGMSILRSSKRPRIIVANPNDEVGKKFLAIPAEKVIPFQLDDANPYQTNPNKVSMTFKGVTFDVPFPGTFTIENALSVATLADAIGISPEVIGRALQHMRPIEGRVERIEMGQKFTAVVDYAHTPDSLKALYGAFPQVRKICVLGNTGGGRDTWKRGEMGAIADKECDIVILTNEDPYDEDPVKIVEAMRAGMARAPLVIMDRREAITHALHLTQSGDAVLITGKGTDPYIMGASGEKTPWSDSGVVREELEKILHKK
ncbi:UDP-N-acetylmuramyl-tripeptide synthetase [Patescibacteria group bacterium]|nr:MAG: UDP-N-acetylmuramyl-tripeptide synthetase [Patescibacteria group bacterium]